MKTSLPNWILVSDYDEKEKKTYEVLLNLANVAWITCIDPKESEIIVAYVGSPEYGFTYDPGIDWETFVRRIRSAKGGGDSDQKQTGVVG